MTVNALIVASFVYLGPCAFILRLKLPKVKGTCPTDTKGWQSQKAQHKRRDHHFRCFRHCGSFTPNTKSREWQATQSVLSRTASKQAKTSRLKALSYYSSWLSSFVACLNDDWHVHAGRTIAAASALQMSSAQVGIKITCSSQAVSY